MKHNKAKRVAPGAPARRLTDLRPDEVLALPPAERAEWSRQNAEDSADFSRMMAFVDSLYPVCRKYYKRSRADFYPELGHGRRPKSSDKPLFEAFARLLMLAEEFRQDPAFLERFSQQMEHNGWARKGWTREIA